MKKSYTDYEAPKPELYFDGEYIIFDSLDELAKWATAEAKVR